MRIFKIVLFSITGILLLFLIAAYFYLNTRTAEYSGEMKLKGLQAEVNTYTDEWGIPHIYAQNEEDAYQALGYLHAQERLFQMDFIRRLGGGRLAEILGEDLVAVDRFFRSIGLAHMAERAVRENHADTTTHFHRAANAYLRGINEFIAEGPTPVEFTLLGIPKEKFEFKDCYTISGYMSFSFTPAFVTDPLLNFIYEELGEAYVQDLAVHWQEDEVKIPVHKNSQTSASPTPSATATGHATATATASIERHLKLHNKLNAILERYSIPEFTGSNGWVLAPARSQSGSVLFENDAHIGYSQPSVWYEAHLEYPGQGFYGKFLAGFPFALIGHNRDVSWGFTMFMNDDMDFYQERINPENPNQVWMDDHWENLEIRTENIGVKDAEDISFEVKSSRHGPMLSHIMTRDEEIIELDSAGLSVWWTYHKFTSRHMELTYRMAQARDMDTFRAVVELIHAPGLNVMYGDRHGNIAWWAAAKLVIRPEHVNSKLVLDGASGRDEPLGFYDFEVNPRSENPPSGFVYSANNQPDSIDNHLYPGYYAPDNRALRIQQLLSSKAQWSLDDFREMVMDHISERDRETAADIVAIIENAEAVGGARLSAEQQQALDYLKSWKGSHSLQDVAPTIYYRLISKILQKVMEDELGEEKYKAFVATMMMKRSYPDLIRNEHSVWWNNVNTENQEDRDDILLAAFEETTRDLGREIGSDPAQWRWEQVVRLEHDHVLGRQEPLNHLFNVGPFPVSGGQEVIDNKDFFLYDRPAFKVRNGAAMRILLDFSDVENSYSINPTGQSGIFTSPHYDDQAEMYNRGHFRKQMMNREEIIEKSRKLVLKPGTVY